MSTQLRLLRNFALGAAAGFLLASCKEFAKLPDAEITLVSPVKAARVGPLTYELTNALPDPFDVFLVTREGVRLSAKPVARLSPGSLDAPSVTPLEVADPAERYYFEFANPANRLYVSERRLPLEGADNFRDLGGFPAADGRQIKWGLFYRADKLSDLTEYDLRYLASINLETVVDLRSEQEVAGAPDVLPQGAEGEPVEYLHLPIYNEAEDTTNIKERILGGLFPQEEADNLLVEVNRLLGSREAYRFQPFIDRFVSGEGVPLAYHCTSGKDRTGFATFLILHTLGVDSALIFDDYLMSNYYRFDRNRRNLRKANLGQYVKPVDPEVLKPLMLVDPRYLRGAVDAIEGEYGTVNAFMEEVYGIDDDMRQRLRDRYLYRNDTGGGGGGGEPEVLSARDAAGETDVSTVSAR